MKTRSLATVAALAIAALPAAFAAQAQAVGTACTTGSVVLSASDRASFTWTLPVTWASNGTGRILVRPVGSTGAFSPVASMSGFRTSGSRTTVASIPALASGTYAWRVELTPPSGAGVTDYCDAAASMAIQRPLAPTLSLAGPKLTADGWRALVGGQSAEVALAAGDAVMATPYVRYQASNGIWGAETRAPAVIPQADVVAVQAYRRSVTGLTGPVTTVALRTDTDPPSVPVPFAGSLTVGTAGAAMGFAQSSDLASGVVRYEQSVVTADGDEGTWSTVAALTARVRAGDAGGTLRIRACDAVGNCSPAADVALLSAASTPVPGAGGGSGSPVRQPGAPSGHGTPAAAAPKEAPRITAIAAKAPAGGAGRLSVTLSRPAEVTFTVTAAGATVATATAWLGEGTTQVRVPAGTRGVRGATVTAHPRAGTATGEVATATMSLPAAAPGRARRESAVAATRMRSGAIAMLYDVDAAVREVVQPSDGATGLTGPLGARRQEPSTSGLFANDDAQWMYGKVKLAEIIDMSADEMVQELQAAIDDSPAHIIGIDEVTTSAADPVAPNVPNARAAAPDPSSAGGQFAAALASLDTPSPYGGTWASRIHVYLAPAMITAIGAGQGPDHNLGRDRRPHFRTYRGVLAGLSHVGGVWMEMYHGLGTQLTTPLTAVEWRAIPTAVSAEFQRAGGDLSRLHLLVTGSDRYPSGALPAGCITPQRCNWALAESTAVGRQLVANGVGGYRLGNTARGFLAEWSARTS